MESICQNCNKVYKLIKDKPAHLCSITCKKEKTRKDYIPKKCKNCSIDIPYDGRRNDFCNKTCSGIYNSKLRCPPNDAQKEKTRKSVNAYFDKRGRNGRKKQIKKKKIIIANKTPKIKKPRIYNSKKLIGEGTFSIVYKQICAYCGEVFYNRRKQKYCNDHLHLFSKNGRSAYLFKFNLFHYPDLFDINHISKVGFYCSKKSKLNLDGITRDHRVSVNEAIKNGYDPYYISHPMNCEIMGFVDNVRKFSKSSITYEELIILVDAYDQSKHQNI